MTDILDPELLRRYSPLDSLKAENLLAIARKSRLHSLEAGRSLFKEGDNDKYTFFLVEGEIEYRAKDKIIGTLSSKQSQSFHALAPSLPRRVRARALTNIKYIALDSDLLDVLLTWDQTGSYEVGDIAKEESESSDDWMTKLLQTRALHNIPPANIQAMFMRMQQLNKRSGDVIIKQGDEGDYFYVVATGRCAVTRETPLNKNGIKLAELRTGDTFGEEALISEAKRNATVSMLTDGSLMRLSKKDFQSLLEEPMLEKVDYESASNLVKNSAAVWLDVRLPSEFNNSNLEGSINIPLYFIRLKLKNLSKKTQYIAVCDTGRRSSAAAYILSERGYQCKVLDQGLKMSGALD